MSNETLTKEGRAETFQIAFGAFAPSLREQIIAGGYDLKPPIVKNSANLTHLQLDAQAVARLRIRSRITESAAVSAEKKIVKELGQLIVKVET